LYGTILLAFGLGCSTGLCQAAERPNVVLILTDDQGTIDLNCYGAHDLATSHLDALAGRGVRFTQFYAGAPVCSPSRASVMTGRYPQRAQLTGNAPSHRGGAGMPSEQWTVAELMKSAGYATGHVGKWHLGYTPETMPNAQGFDDSFGHMGGCIDNYSHFFYWRGPNRHDLWRNGKEIWADGQYFPDLMVQQCNQFLESNRQRPFFLYWALNVPHYPLQATDTWRQHYAKMPAPRRMYAAFVSTMDERIGQVLERLDQLGLTRDTIVIFQSDHGHSTEERTFGGGGSAGPYRGAKFSLFEGGIRVPAIISWPTNLPEGVARNQMATALDWLPTIAQLCRIPLPDRRLDGKSLVDVIQSESAPSPHRQLHWQSGRGWNRKPQWAVREGDWKLLGNPNDTSQIAPLRAGDERFLVNLKQDPGERRNLRKTHPDVVERLEELHERWLEEVGQQ
jgi:arylsulfatase A-like enzyme